MWLASRMRMRKRSASMDQQPTRLALLSASSSNRRCITNFWLNVTRGTLLQQLLLLLLLSLISC